MGVSNKLPQCVRAGLLNPLIGQHQDILVQILSHLPQEELNKCAHVNKAFKAAVDELQGVNQVLFPPKRTGGKKLTKVISAPALNEIPPTEQSLHAPLVAPEQLDQLQAPQKEEPTKEEPAKEEPSIVKPDEVEKTAISVHTQMIQQEIIKLQKSTKDKKFLESRRAANMAALNAKRKTRFGRFVSKISFSKKGLRLITSLIARISSSVKKEIRSRNHLKKSIAVDRVHINTLHSKMTLEKQKLVKLVSELRLMKGISAS